MPRQPRTVADVIQLDDADATPRNPEAASDAVEGLTAPDNPGADVAAPPPTEEPPSPAKKQRRTKAELEADVLRLEQAVRERDARAAANAPDTIAAMARPLALTFKGAGRMMAAWKGDHWNLTESDAQLLGDAWAPCIGPLLSKYPSSVLWASAIAATYAVAYPRLAVDKQRALDAGEKKDDKEVART